MEPGNFGFGKKRDCTTYVAKTKTLISCAVDLHLCFRTYARSLFSHDVAQVWVHTEFSSEESGYRKALC